MLAACALEWGGAKLGTQDIKDTDLDQPRLKRLLFFEAAFALTFEKVMFEKKIGVSQPRKSVKQKSFCLTLFRL